MLEDHYFDNYYKVYKINNRLSTGNNFHYGIMQRPAAQFGIREQNYL